MKANLPNFPASHLILLLLFFTSSNALAELALPRLFSDHMVLQRDAAVDVWGWADAGSTVSVSIAGQQRSTRADADGRWRLQLTPVAASGPHALKVTAEKAIVVKDVYFGDVWLAGGQSNMEWKLSWKIDNAASEIADSHYPQIRFFEIANVYATQKQEKLQSGEWKVANPENAPNFSAIAWLFAKRNHLDKKVAVGIIDSNWGGTPAEAWISPEAIVQVPGYEEQAKNIYATNRDWAGEFAQNEKNTAEFYARLGDDESVLKTGAFKFGYDTSGWKTVSLPNTAPFTDLVWLRKEVMLDSGNTGTAILELGDLVQEAFVFVNEKLIKKEDWQITTSRHELPPETLKPGRNLIAIRIGNSWNNRPSAGKPDMLYLEVNNKKMDLSEGWLYSNKVEPPMPAVKRYEWTPGFLYNAMIHPIRHYDMRGVIWYQGESNVEKAVLYGDLFKALIKDWRVQWDQSLDFLFVQLAGHLKHQNPQPDSAWAQLRDMQASALTLPDTGMATAVDIGDQEDIHPRNKQDVAKRLWLEARRVSFGENIVSHGPVYRFHKLKRNKVEIEFTSTAQGLRTSDGAKEVSGFIIAGADGQFHPATAVIKGNKVVVWNDKVDKPTAVKYAWADFPIVNLYNSENLPALPFQLQL